MRLFVITTAAVPGRRAPLLLDADALAGMRPGAVVVDMAAATGGNTALTVAGTTIAGFVFTWLRHRGLDWAADLLSSSPAAASFLFQPRQENLP